VARSEVDDRGDRRSLVQEALDHVAIVAAVTGFAVLLVKVTRVSHLNIRTSHALVATAGPLEIVLGELVNHFPRLLFVAGSLGLWWAIGSLKAGAGFTPTHAAVFVAAFFAILLMPWPLVVALALVASARLLRRAPPHPPKNLRRYYVLVAVTAVLIVVDADVWLPAETFVTTDGASFVGYALREAESDEGWLVVLDHDDRIVLHLRLETVAEREPCRLPEEAAELETFPSLLQIAIGESSTLPEAVCR
jgi:hypothetical protein